MVFVSILLFKIETKLVAFSRFGIAHTVKYSLKYKLNALQWRTLKNRSSSGVTNCIRRFVVYLPCVSQKNAFITCTKFDKPLLLSRFPFYFQDNGIVTVIVCCCFYFCHKDFSTHCHGNAICSFVCVCEVFFAFVVVLITFTGCFCVELAAF